MDREEKQNYTFSWLTDDIFLFYEYCNTYIDICGEKKKNVMTLSLPGKVWCSLVYVLLPYHVLPDKTRGQALCWEFHLSKIVAGENNPMDSEALEAHML